MQIFFVRNPLSIPFQALFARVDTNKNFYFSRLRIQQEAFR